MASHTGVRFATRIIVAAGLVAVAATCGDGPTPPSGPASLSLAPSTDIRLFAIGETAQITVTPKDASGNPVSAPVTWTSSNQAVATVASTGPTTATVTATGFGTSTIRAAASATVFAEVTVTVQQAQFNVNAGGGRANACEIPDMRTYRIEHESARLIIAADVNNPSGGFTAADYQAFAATFESTVWPVVTENFGVPADIDGNGKVIAFFTRAVNELSPQNSQSVVGGFFFGRDLFPKTARGGLGACPTSNEAEMFYLLVPDPNGEVNKNKRSLDLVRRVTSGVIAHEMQHLINASRRLFINQSPSFEVTYMEEGLSHIAEELVFYHASGDLRPKRNIGIDEIRNSQARVDAFNNYMASNSGRFSAYLKDPSANAPYDKDDDLATRGAIWSFLRYLADRGAGAPFTEVACSNPVVLTGPGASCMVEGSAAQQFSVPAGTSAGEFAIIAFAKDAPITTVASATSTTAVTGPPNPSLAPGGALLSTIPGGSLSAGAPVVLDNAFHARLRQTERQVLPALVPGARAAYSMKRRAAAESGARRSAEWTGPAMAAAVVEPVWSQLVNSNDTGIVNLRGRFGQDISGAAQDWAAANYMDDTGLGTPPTQYMHQSWNFRSLLAALTSNNMAYPLRFHSLTTSVTQPMVDGGSAYYRFGLAADATSTVSFTVNGGAPPAGLKLVVLRTK